MVIWGGEGKRTMIKVELNVCPNYNSCFARRMTLLESEADSHCLECDLYRSYSLGFSQGVRQAVDAMTSAKPLLAQSFSRKE